jgi:glycosyltransferase involved in cell wall biosynthesis
MRYVWTPELDVRHGRRAPSALLWPFRAVDRRLNAHVTAFAANSNEVRARIERYWGRSAEVIYPPVDSDYFRPASESQLPFSSYVLGAGRWIPYKRFDLTIEAAALADLPLVIAGGGPDEQRLRYLADQHGGQVVFEPQPSRARLRDLYTGAAVFAFPGHEDFGIMPVEAMLCGTPVAGVARGGLLETVVHGETGCLVDRPDAAELANAFHQAAGMSGNGPRMAALYFGVDRFQREFLSWLERWST